MGVPKDGKLRVLVLEDESSYMDLVRKELEKEGFSVMPASDVREAFRQFDADPPPELALLDICLTDGTSLGFVWYCLNKMRCPVFLMSGRVDESFRQEVHRLGARDLFLKPLDFPRLVKSFRDVSSGGTVLKPRDHVSSFPAPPRIPRERPSG